MKKWIVVALLAVLLAVSVASAKIIVIIYKDKPSGVCLVATAYDSTAQNVTIVRTLFPAGAENKYQAWIVNDSFKVANTAPLKGWYVGAGSGAIIAAGDTLR